VLNRILAATISAQEKGAKADSANLPPNLLTQVRFTGGANADALALLKMAGRLQFPPAFEAAPLADLRAPLDRNFAAAAAPVLNGKPADPQKVAALEATVEKTGKTLTPLIKEMEFENAIAARRFVNKLNETVKVLKAPGAAGLFDPKWATEGTSVADLVKRMARYKLMFGPADAGGEEAYLALHRGLSAYLIALEPKPQTKP